MKDIDIRINTHKKILLNHHKNDNTLVIDELGLKHGNCRADIAVINGGRIEQQGNKNDVFRKPENEFRTLRPQWTQISALSSISFAQYLQNMGSPPCQYRSRGR